MNADGRTTRVPGFRCAAILLGLLLMGGLPEVLQGQEPECHQPSMTLEEVKDWLVARIDQPEGEAVVVQFMSSAVLAPCSVLSDADLNAVIDALLRWVAIAPPPPVLGRALHRGFLVARAEHGAELALETPLPALVFSVEEGRTKAHRGNALTTLRRLGEEPEVRQTLLSWVRAPTGPPGFEDLPEHIARNYLYLMEAIPDAAGFRAELEGDPSRIANPRVRCWAEGRGRPGQTGPPGRASPCP